MEAYFTSLNKRQTMLLLTAVTFSGQDALATFDHLRDEEAELLKYRAHELLQIPRERRIPLLVAELKRMIHNPRPNAFGSDAEKLAGVLRSERPPLVDVLLRALPGPVATAVRAHLPESGVKGGDIRPEVLNLVRWKLDEILTRSLPSKPTFRFADVKQLAGREALTLLDRLGVRALGAALAGVEDAGRDAFLGALSPELRPLCQKAISQSESRKLLPEDSAELLALHRADKAPMDALRSAGAQRFMRACMAQSPEFAQYIVERFRLEAGTYLMRWFKEERARTIQRGDGGRMEVVVELEQLAEKGLIERPFRLPPPARPALPHPPAGRAPPREAAPLREHRAHPAGAGSPGAGSRDEVSGSFSVSRAPRDSLPVHRPPDPRIMAAIPALKDKPLLPVPPHLRPGARVEPPGGGEVSQSRRDFMAERLARQAGVAGARRAPSKPPPPPPPSAERQSISLPGRERRRLTPTAEPSNPESSRTERSATERSATLNASFEHRAVTLPEDPGPVRRSPAFSKPPVLRHRPKPPSEPPAAPAERGPRESQPSARGTPTVGGAFSELPRKKPERPPPDAQAARHKTLLDEPSEAPTLEPTKEPRADPRKPPPGAPHRAPKRRSR